MNAWKRKPKLKKQTDIISVHVIEQVEGVVEPDL